MFSKLHPTTPRIIIIPQFWSISPRNCIISQFNRTIKLVIEMIIKRLRDTRESMNLKKKDLTTLFGVTFSTISGWETGKDTIPLKQLIKYANEFNYSLDYLFGLTNKNEKYLPLKIDLDNIAKNLKQIRKQNKKTQQDIAKVLNTSSSAYAHYENARYLIPTNFIYALSTIYPNFSIDKVLGREKK